MSTTELQIDSEEKYRSCVALGLLLLKLKLPSGKELMDDMIYVHGNEWEPCDDCGNTLSDCECENDYNRASVYDDESSFEED